MKQNSIDLFESENLPFKSFYSTGLTHEETVHDEPEVIWLLYGEMTILCEEKNHKLGQDDVFFINSHQKHSLHSVGQTISISFRFKSDHLKRLNLHFDRIPFKNRVYTIGELVHKYHQVPLIMLQLIHLMRFGDLSESTRYQLQGYFNMYLFDLYTVRLKDRYLDKKKKNYDPYLLRFHAINTYIQKHYAQKISLAMLAGVAGISTHRLSHFIKEILGISFQEYIQSVRLAKALEALKQTDMPIEHIVVQCGFSDQKYLNGLMKASFHVTALKYRKLVKQEQIRPVSEISARDMLTALTQRFDYIRQHVHVADTYGLQQNLDGLE